jgi:energy-coupling factor transport system ATP-binding protein
MSIIVKNLSFTYSPKTPFERQAVKDVSFAIDEGEFIGIIGSTGSGKSTLIQHLNGLIKLQSGSITVYDTDLKAKKPNYKQLRRDVGMLFQYPEYQLFAETVLDDVCFGPMNFGATKEEATVLAQNALESVGLNFEKIKDKSPFELSGGQKRRVAIAGVIASNPKILILDEPTAGLDPKGKREILDLIVELKKTTVKTAIIISHNMDEIAEYTDRALVMCDGKLIKDTSTRELFSDKANFEGTGLDLPHTANIANLLTNEGFDFTITPLNTDELITEIVRNLGGKR